MLHIFFKERNNQQTLILKKNKNYKLVLKFKTDILLAFLQNKTCILVFFSL